MGRVLDFMSIPTGAARGDLEFNRASWRFFSGSVCPQGRLLGFSFVGTEVRRELEELSAEG